MHLSGLHLQIKEPTREISGTNIKYKRGQHFLTLRLTHKDQQDDMVELDPLESKPSVPEAITERQYEVLCFIDGFWKEHRHSPSIQNICDAFDFSSTRSGRDVRNALKKKGYIRFDSNKHRHMVVLIQPENAVLKKRR